LLVDVIESTGIISIHISYFALDGGAFEGMLLVDVIESTGMWLIIIIFITSVQFV